LAIINDKDSDGDGLSDYEEVYIYNTNPLNSDTDGDKLSDYEEINIYGTDPLNSDTDEDGLTDYEEMKAWVILELGTIVSIFYNAPNTKIWELKAWSWQLKNSAIKKSR